nr:hypothetical protein CPAG_01181 [Coccidioides posadasii RMSCC 3488]
MMKRGDRDRDHLRAGVEQADPWPRRKLHDDHHLQTLREEVKTSPHQVTSTSSWDRRACLVTLCNLTQCEQQVDSFNFPSFFRNGNIQPKQSKAMARHRHQASLEGIINFSGPESLPADQRARAKQRFYSIIKHFRPAEASDVAYSRPFLVRYTYEYSRSELSQDTLRAFFDFMGLDVGGDRY